MTHATLRGVFLSDRPLGSQEGAGPLSDSEATVLAVEFGVPLRELADYELIEEGKPYREWCIPAHVIRRCGKVRRATAHKIQ